MHADAAEVGDHTGAALVDGHDRRTDADLNRHRFVGLAG